MQALKLDDLYYMTAAIYSEQNAHRTLFSTYTHFVEVCGMLTIQRRKKVVDYKAIEKALCRALGWFFPLIAKCKILSIEDVIWMKYPFVCPYCRQMPHDDLECKFARGLDCVDHDALRAKQKENLDKKPKTLNQWREMFQKIYPRNARGDENFSIIGLFEEIGEMAESLRVLEQHPKYLIGEIADVFSWIIGVANEYNLYKLETRTDVFDFEEKYLKNFPGLCISCGNQICRCPSIPKGTIGRMAKELEIKEDINLFATDTDEMIDKGKQVSLNILNSLGGYNDVLSIIGSGIIGANKELTDFFLDIANQIEQNHGNEASGLRAIAFKLTSSKFDLNYDKNVQKDIQNASETIYSKNILLILSSPDGYDKIQTQKEANIIEDCKIRAQDRDLMKLDVVFAAKVENIRMKLLNQKYQIVHFAGHGNNGNICLCDEKGNAKYLGLDTLRKYLLEYPEIECVILNACYSLDSIEKPLAKFTVGMEQKLTDKVAHIFTKGFYEAYGANMSIERSIKEGKHLIEMEGFSSDLIKVLREKQ